MSVPLSVSVKLCKSSQAACLQHSESQTFARKEKSWKDLGQPRTFPRHIASICYFVLLMNFFNESLCDLASVLPLLWVCHTSSSRRFNFLSQLTRPFSGSASTWAESEHHSPTVLSAHQQQCLKWHPSTCPHLFSYPLGRIRQIRKKRCKTWVADPSAEGHKRWLKIAQAATAAQKASRDVTSNPCTKRMSGSIALL